MDAVIASITSAVAGGDAERGKCLEDLNALCTGVTGEKDLLAFRLQVGVALQCVFDRELNAAPSALATSPPLAPEVLNRYLDLAVQLAQKDLATSSLPLQVFADLFNACTINDCQYYWTLLEDKQEQLLPLEEQPGAVARRELLLLKLSNSLLDRLSRVVDTGFAGRIQLFLARLLPLEHKASLNLAGNFNVDNDTVVDVKTDQDDVRGSF
jgi:hypothetical protein